MSRNFLFLSLLTILFLSGCNMMEDFSEAQKKQKKVTERLTTKLGGQVQVGWNIHNGRLAQVTVLVPAKAAADSTLRELKGMVAPVVAEEFSEKPARLQISAAYSKDQL